MAELNHSKRPEPSPRPLPRRFNLDIGDSDEDLEAMQQDFFNNSNSRPAATVLRHSKPPTVSRAEPPEAKSTSAQPQPTTAATAASGSSPTQAQVIEFAQRMSAAIKDYEASPQKTKDATAQETPRTASRPQKKKLSLFAQRRLALKAKDPTTLGDSAETAEPDNNSSATFLPKLMAPVPEHETTAPVHAPRPTAGTSNAGFPEIPDDVSHQGDDIWARMRSQVSQENTKRIGAMSDSEIQEAQEELKSMFSSEFLDRFKRGRQSATELDPDTAKPKGERRHVRFSEEKNKVIPPPQVLDQDDDSDSDDAALSPPPPPPLLEWVDESNNVIATEPTSRTNNSNNDGDMNSSDLINADNNETGAEGSEFYANLKRKYFPKEVVEEAKLAWILGQRQSKSPMEKALRDAQKAQDSAPSDLLARDNAHIRFGFNGEIIDASERDNVPTESGLHHHGDDPDSPGYTIPELLHLSRSTVPSQRSVAMNVLGFILHRINVAAWSVAETAQVYSALLDWELEKYLVQGISADRNKTSKAETIVTLWIWIVEMAKYKVLVRLSATHKEETQQQKPRTPPGTEIKLSPEAGDHDNSDSKGVFVERTFRAFDGMVSDVVFLDAVCETVELELVPDRQLSMLAECVKALEGMSDVFGEKIRAHSKALIVLQHRFPFIMKED